MPLITLKRRNDFLRLRGGARWSSSNFVVEARLRPDDRSRTATGTPVTGCRFGFTVTKKLGNAVVRNRIRRRLREIIRQELAARSPVDCDYVVVARAGALHCPPEKLRSDLLDALDRVDRKLSASRR